MFDAAESIYYPGPIVPVVKIRENMAVWTGGVWEHFRAEYIEPIPQSTPTIVNMVTVPPAITSLAAGGTMAKRVVPILQVNMYEFLHLRWEALDNVEGILWEQAGQTRFQSRGMVARVSKATPKNDPYFTTTTFWIIGLGAGRDMNLEVRNPMGYATPVARFAFWGYRYLLVDLTVSMSAADQALLRRGDLDAVKRLIGPTTWLPAEGRV